MRFLFCVLPFALRALQLAAPAPSVFLALDRTSRHIWNLQHVTHPGGKRICKLGNVEILETQTGGDQRTMVFANEEKSAVEAVVECEDYGNGEERCATDCTPCACTAKMDEPSRLGTSYHRVIASQLSAVCEQPSRVLLVGLGGSVLTQYLADNCPKMNIDVFEISPDVVSAAQDFFGLRECRERNLGRIGVSTIDAAVGLSQLSSGGEGSLELADGFTNGTDAYDAVVIDCFVGEGKIPDACRSRETLEMVRGVLRPGGQLLQNAWGKSLQLPVVAEDFSRLTEDYRTVFSQFEDLHVPMPPQVDFVHILKGTK